MSVTNMIVALGCLAISGYIIKKAHEAETHRRECAVKIAQKHKLTFCVADALGGKPLTIVKGFFVKYIG